VRITNCFIVGLHKVLDGLIIFKPHLNHASQCLELVIIISLNSMLDEHFEYHFHSHFWVDDHEALLHDQYLEPVLQDGGGHVDDHRLAWVDRRDRADGSVAVWLDLTLATSHVHYVGLALVRLATSTHP
jgi:hypothetical protein